MLAVIFALGLALLALVIGGVGLLYAIDHPARALREGAVGCIVVSTLIFVCACSFLLS